MTFAQPFSGYEILAKIGAGAMGTVFKARQKKMGRIVALKVLRPSLARNERFVERLRREARIVGSLNHPNIVAGFDLGEEGGYHFFVMELVEGNSLKGLLAEWGMFPEQQVLDVAIQVTEALDHAYQRGIIHRDIKPGNILIDPQNVVKLSDMGLAKGPTDLTLTRDGATVGTPQYISPEQARNPQDVDVRSDLYSLGATIFHMATGSPPFRGESIGDLIAKVLSEREPWAKEVNPLVSEGLNLVIRKLLAKDPDLRYQDPAELLADLRRVQSDEQPEVDPKRLDLPDRSWRSWRLTSGLSAALVLVIALLWVAWSGGSAGTVQDDPVRLFREALYKEVRLARSPREEFTVVARFAARAQGSLQEQMCRDKRADLSVILAQDLKELLGAFLDQERIAWLGEPGNWTDTEARFADLVEQAIVGESGYRQASLPPQVRASLDGAVRSLRREVTDLIVRRDRLYLQDYLAYLKNDLESEVDRLLDENRFVEAGRELDEMLGSYHGSDGRPDLSQMPEELFRGVNEEMQVRRARLRGRIMRRQGFLVSRLLSEIGDDLAELRSRLNGESDPRMLWRDYESFAAEIARHYPAADAFTADVVNPWVEVDNKLRRLDRDIHTEIRVLEQGLLSEDLSQAYRSLLVEGEAGATIDLLRTRSIGEKSLQEDRRLHVDLLANAVALRELLFTTLLGGRAVIELRLRGGPRVRLRSSADNSFGLTQEGSEGESPIQLINLDMDQVLRLAGKNFASLAEERGLVTGLAFWNFVTGVQRNKALSSLPQNGLRRFFTDVLQPLVDEIRRQDSGLEGAAAGALTRLRQAVEHRDLAGAERGLSQFQSGLAETLVARNNRRNLRQFGQWVEIERRRLAAENSYRQLLPRGALLHVDEELHLELEYSLKWISECELPKGWSRERDHLKFVEPPTQLAEVSTRMLQLPLMISGDRSYQLALKLRMPVADLDPQLLILAVGDVHTAIALMPGASMAFAVLASGAVTASREELMADLRRELHGLESQPEILVEGGIHELIMHFDVRRNRVFVRVELEGHELTRGDFAVGAGESLMLGLSSLQELSLYGIKLREL